MNSIQKGRILVRRLLTNRERIAVHAILCYVSRRSLIECPTVSCSYDLFVKLWNVDNDYQNFATLRGHEHSVSSVRFLPGDDRVVSASRDQTVRIWSIATTYARFEYACIPS